MRRMDRVPMRRVLREIAILLPFLREYCQVMFLLLVLSLELMPLPWVEIWALLLLVVLVEEEAIPLLNMAEWIPTWTQSLPWHSESVWRRNVLGRNEFQLRQQNPTKRRNLVMVKMMQLLQTTQNQWRGLLLGLRMMRMPCCSKHLQCQWQKIRLLVLLRKLLLLQEKVLLWTWVTTTTMQRCKWRKFATEIDLAFFILFFVCLIYIFFPIQHLQPGHVYARRKRGEDGRWA
mmetsp:Transcript_24971/g.38300  ORF Transcript_24971/g.38300 Transcript_24971/m.38300 type:complete len:232 (-) Transcript_24971:221-916(-)